MLKAFGEACNGMLTAQVSIVPVLYNMHYGMETTSDPEFILSRKNNTKKLRKSTVRTTFPFPIFPPLPQIYHSLAFTSHCTRRISTPAPILTLQSMLSICPSLISLRFDIYTHFSPFCIFTLRKPTFILVADVRRDSESTVFIVIVLVIMDVKKYIDSTLLKLNVFAFVR